jgi:hypothetical protein
VANVDVSASCARQSILCLSKAFPLFLEQVVFLGRLKGEIYEYIF